MDTYQSAEETSRCLQHKSPPPHSGRPLARLRHKRIDSHLHRTTTPNDNNSKTTSKCLRTHLPSATRHSSHRHSGLHPTFNMAPPQEDVHHSAGPTKSSMTPSCPYAMPWRQRKIEHPGDRSFVMLRVLPRKKPKQVSKYTFVTLFSGKADTHPPPRHYVTLGWPHSQITWML